MVMADSDRIVFPDEVQEVKATAAAENTTKTEDTTTVEEAPPVEVNPLQMRNMIVVPPNCPAGYQMGADGVCRQVFD